jgi:hypothetical protein
VSRPLDPRHLVVHSLDDLRRQLDEIDRQNWEATREQWKERERRDRDEAVDKLLARRSAEQSAAVERQRELRLRERAAEIQKVYARLVREGLPHERIDVAEELDPPRSERTIRRFPKEVRDAFGIELTWPPGQSWTLP